MATVNPSYAKIFDLLKLIEIQTETLRHPLSFSVHGRATDKHFNFKLQFASNRVGIIKVEPLEPGEINLAEEVIRTQRNTILPEDVTAAHEQLNVLEVYPNIVDAITAIFEGLRKMELSSPVFTLNRAADENNRLVYILGLAAYVVDDSFMPSSRLTMTIEVRAMSSFEKTAVALKKQRAKNAAEGLAEPTVRTTERGPLADQAVEVVKRIVDDLDGKPSNSVQAVEEFIELTNNLPVSDLNSVSMEGDMVEHAEFEQRNPSLATPTPGYRVRDLTPQRVGMGRKPSTREDLALPEEVKSTIDKAVGEDINMDPALMKQISDRAPVLMVTDHPVGGDGMDHTREYLAGLNCPQPEGKVQKVAVLTGSGGHRNLPGLQATLAATAASGRISLAEPPSSSAMLNNKHNPKD